PNTQGTDVNGDNITDLHKTQSGDTYGSLSKKYGVSIDNLKAWNGYGEKSIPTGVDLIVSQEGYNQKHPATTIPSGSTTNNNSHPLSELINPTIEEAGKASGKSAEYVQKQLREEGLLGASNGKNYQSPGMTKPKHDFDISRPKEMGNGSYTTKNYLPNTKLTNGLKLIAKGAEFTGPIMDSYALTEVIRGRAETYTLLPLSFVFEDFSNEVDKELLKVAVSQGYEATNNYVSSRPSSKTGLQMIYVNQEDYLGLLSGKFGSLSEVKSMGDMQQGYAILIQQQEKSFNILAGFKFR
ncbi:MAG: LysM peptidoglycan-binding domain-containing protein, partial [Cytophaga sp.]|uniref:LysM peptidoglycan-binding domain-containing protein n=1 Tax=Cytophaga sp. TaxID=29535 RepID=UPI003F7D6636